MQGWQVSNLFCLLPKNVHKQSLPWTSKAISKLPYCQKPHLQQIGQRWNWWRSVIEMSDITSLNNMQKPGCSYYHSFHIINSRTLHSHVSTLTENVFCGKFTLNLSWCDTHKIFKWVFFFQYFTFGLKDFPPFQSFNILKYKFSLLTSSKSPVIHFEFGSTPLYRIFTCVSYPNGTNITEELKGQHAFNTVNLKGNNYPHLACG